MKFIKKFSSIEEYEAAELSYPATSLVSGTVIYDKEAPAPPTPTFEGKWLATYSDSHTSSAECDSSSAITQNEITLDNLVSVEIGDCVTSIGDYAFVFCSSLTNITIPDIVTSIGEAAFFECAGLTSITIEATTPPTIGAHAFDNTNNCPIYVPAASLSAYQSAWDEYDADRIQAIA